MQTSNTQKKNFENRDEFNREPIAQHLITLLQSPVDISPLVIDGDWGVGKSEFCEKTINLIREQYADKLHVIYINAFEEDHIDQPLLSLLAALYISFSCEAEENDFLKKFTRGASAILKVLSKVGVAHLLKVNADTVSECIEELEKSVTQVDSENLFNRYCSANEELDIFKSILAEKSAEKTIVLFIDELDRCRPNFAIDFLEVIKHVFDIEGVKIVFIANLHQLKTSISHLYGGNTGIDTEIEEKYLEKFISHIISLPPYVNGTNVLASEKYAHNLIDLYKDLASWCIEPKYTDPRKSPFIFNKDLNTIYPELNHFHYGIMEIVHQYKLTLREVERLIRYLRIFSALCESGRISYMSKKINELSAGEKILVSFAIVCTLKESRWITLNDDNDYKNSIKTMISNNENNSNRWLWLLSRDLIWKNPNLRFYDDEKVYLEGMFTSDLYLVEKRMEFMRNVARVLKLQC